MHLAEVSIRLSSLYAITACCLAKMRCFQLLLAVALGAVALASSERLVCGEDMLYQNLPKPRLDEGHGRISRRDSRVYRFGPVVIKTYFTVLAKSRRREDGYVPENMIHYQLYKLNEAFRGTGFSFILGDLKYFSQPRWLEQDKERSEKQKLAMLRTMLHRGNYESLNLIFVNYIYKDRNILGNCYLPQPMTNDSVLNVLDSCVMLSKTAPSLEPSGWRTGIVAIHEVGHFLGLDHFEWRRCEKPVRTDEDEDYCWDIENTKGTNWMVSPRGSQEGSFSLWQIEQMQKSWNKYRSPDAQSPSISKSARQRFLADFTWKHTRPPR